MAYRIALIIDSLAGGGAEKVVQELAMAFTDAGHKAVIISLQGRSEYQISQSVSVRYLSEQTRVKYHKKSLRLKHARELKACISELEKEFGEFDLILSNLDEAHYIVSACELPNTHYIIHNAIKGTLKRAILMGPSKYFRQRRLFKSLNHKSLICVSKGLEQELKSQALFSPQTIKHIYNPFDLDKIIQLSKEKNEAIPNQKYLIHVGRYARQKRHDLLFKAFRGIPSEYKLVCLGANVKALSKLAKKEGILDRLILPGFQQNPYNWIAKAECLVLSSDFEGFGNVLMEALVCGTRVVSTKCQFGPEEILTGELKQFLVPVGDPHKICETIGRALKSPRPSLSPEKINQFLPDAIAAQYLKLIPQKSPLKGLQYG
jgi:glycosyltransferase involved in cell wall biosynthesis